MITYQREEWHACLEEMEALWPLHWEEVAGDKDVIKLEPNYAMYDSLVSTGQLHLITARADGKLIGYHVSIVRPHLHYVNSLSAFTDMYFIHPDFRKGMVGVNIFRAAEKSLKQRGVQKMFTGTKLSLDMGRIFERLGWKETERLYTKVIED